MGVEEGSLKDRTERAIADLLQVLIPADTLKDHPHLLDTPRRVASWLMQYTTNGETLDEVLGPIFQEPYQGMVVVKDISFSALCAHHLLPFQGKAAVGYVPNGRVVGLSKLARIVHHFAERVTLQEHITKGIVDGLKEKIDPIFVGAYLYDVSHGCMVARGVREDHAVTNTFDLAFHPTLLFDATVPVHEQFWRVFNGRP